MARIRSIKPDFFTSETVASLPISARLTFIGLWTHADDNGVALDNERLIAAALWPLEDDPLEALRRLSGDLQKIATAGLISRYEHSGRRYLFITGWDEHQKISHPSKPRYPRPPADLPPPTTSGNTSPKQSSGDSPEDLGSPPESLRPEQGAGSKEQGAGNGGEQGAAAAATRERAKPPLPPDPEDDLQPLRERLDSVGLSVRWTKLEPGQRREIVALITRHGVERLVKAALGAHIPGKPAAYAQAWLGIWRDLPNPATPIRASAGTCPDHKLDLPCRSCAADQKAAS